MTWRGARKRSGPGWTTRNAPAPDDKPRDPTAAPPDPGPTRADVEVAVGRLFPAEDHPALLEVLDLYGEEPHERERERVQLALVTLSNGNVDLLLDLIRCARQDYRDVLYWNELAAGVRDPVAESIAGLPLLTPELTPKRLELLTEAVPDLGRVAVLWNPVSAAQSKELEALDVVAAALGVQVEPVSVTVPADLEETFRGLERAGAEGLLVLTSALHQMHLQRIADLARRIRLPAICELAEFAEAGGLLSYGPPPAEMARRAVSRLEARLRGQAAPGRDQPLTCELVVNLETARAIALAVPAWLLARAQRVIE